MNKLCPDGKRCAFTGSPAQNHFRFRIATSIVLAGIVCSGSTAVNAQSGSSRIGPSGGEVAGAAIGVGAAVAIVAWVAVNHSHHSLIGCVFNGPSGFKLKAGDSKVYAIEGDSAGIKAGDKVKLHGSHVKTKGGNGDQVFRVEKASKDYGPCHVDVAESLGDAQSKP